MKKMLIIFVISAMCGFADQVPDQIKDARQAMVRGEYVNAEQMLNIAIDAAEHSKSPTALDQPLDLLAQVYQREKKFQDAVAVEQRRIDLWAGLFGENAVIVGRILGQMAETEKQAGNLTDAESHSRRALAILTAAFVDKPPAAQAAVDLADILLMENRTDEADQMLAVAQKMFEASVGSQSMLTVGVASRLSKQRIANTGGAYKIGNGVTQPRILKRVEPQYSEEARKNKLQGSISLSVVVDATGAPTQIAVLRPLGMGLDEMAVQAVSQWKFSPGTKNGVAVAVYAQIQMTFHLL